MNAKNVFGEKLKLCGYDPITGYNRRGFCSLSSYDTGTHIVCAIVTKEFLKFTKSRGNDLITARNGFSGLKPGNSWCLCVLRWIEAYNNGVAPPIDLEATSENVLKYVDINTLLKYDHRLGNKIY